jgi:hypothetical protein
VLIPSSARHTNDQSPNRLISEISPSLLPIDQAEASGKVAGGGNRKLGGNIVPFTMSIFLIWDRHINRMKPPLKEQHYGLLAGFLSGNFLFRFLGIRSGVETVLEAGSIPSDSLRTGGGFFRMPSGRARRTLPSS